MYITKYYTIFLLLFQVFFAAFTFFFSKIRCFSPQKHEAKDCQWKIFLDFLYVNGIMTSNLLVFISFCRNFTVSRACRYIKKRAFDSLFFYLLLLSLSSFCCFFFSLRALSWAIFFSFSIRFCSALRAFSSNFCE